MEMAIHADESETSMVYENVHDIQVRTDALKNRPREDSEVRAAAPATFRPLIFGVKLYRLVAVTFGLLCVLQAAVNISLWLVLFSDTEARHKNLTEERYSLERRLGTLDSQLNSLTEERDKLKRINSDTETRCKILSEEKEGLERRMNTTVSELSSLTAERDKMTRALGSLGWQVFGESLYYISSTKKSWPESRSDCVGKGAHLMIINSRQEQEFTRQLTKSMWIGLTDAESEGTWKWVDGTPLTTSYWANGEPNNKGEGNNEDCAEVTSVLTQTFSLYRTDKRWNDRACEELNHWICEKTLAP